MWKILDANIKAINDKGHIRFFTASQVSIAINGEKKPEKPKSENIIKKTGSSMIGKFTKPKKPKKTKKNTK